MKLVEIFNLVIPELANKEKKAIIQEMLGALVDQDMLDAGAQDKALKALLDREELGSTGIGRGVAVPHAKINAIKDLIGVFGRAKNGVPFDSLDGEPVDIFFMLLSSRKASDQHLVALAKIAALVKDDNFVRFLRNGTSIDEIKDILSEADDTLFNG